MLFFDSSNFAWMDLPSTRFPDHILPLTQGMELCWEITSPPRYPQDLTTKDDATALFCWWLLSGLQNMPAIPFHCCKEHLTYLCSSFQLPSARKIPVWLYGYWTSLSVLQEKYNLNNDSSLAQFITWWIFEANQHTEPYFRLPLGMELFSFLRSSDNNSFLPLPRGLSSFLLLRQDLERFNVDTAEGRAAFLCWWLLYPETTPFPSLDLGEEAFPYLLKEDAKGVPLFAKAILIARPDLIPYYSVYSEEERLKLYRWFWFSSDCPTRRDMPLNRALMYRFIPDEYSSHNAEFYHKSVTLSNGGVFVNKILPDVETDRNNMSNDTLFDEIITFIETKQLCAKNLNLGKLQPHGINIIGFAKGELGIGEDVRMAVKASDANDIPFVVYNPSFAIASRQEDFTLEGCIANEPQYAANVIFLPGIETLRLFFFDGDGLFAGRYNIGAWQWELPNWPMPLKQALPLAQEFWLSSRFTTGIMERATNIPVFHMPMAVELPEFTPLGRTAHGLPDDTTLFLYIFDGLSWGARKNPMGAILAFQDAFSNRKDVRFVIKTMNATEAMPHWLDVLKIAQSDERIICINEIYTKKQLLSLFSCCDVYVSLHRAEGFGRTIAEAMLLELPVIATSWSGNSDFTTQETAFTIGGKLVPVKKDEYIFWEGQEWCEPDHDEAVAAMQESLDKPEVSKMKAAAGRRLICEQYSAINVGKRYKKRLEEIGVF